MNQVKHTPGPWAFDKTPTACGHCLRIGSVEQLQKEREFRTHSPSYACLYVDYGNGAKEAEANARLIAASPDLLDVCKTLLKGLEAASKACNGNFIEIVLLRNVIAQAEGEGQ